MNIYSSPVDIVFLGDSITQQFEWQDVYPNLSVRNRGIGSDTTLGVTARLDSIEKLKPQKVFLLIGINDLAQKRDIEEIAVQYKSIFEYFENNMTNSQLYVISVLPVSSDNAYIDNNKIIELNAALESICIEKDIIFIDLFSEIYDNEQKQMIPQYTYDGVHLTFEGYLVWIDKIAKYIG